VLLQHGAVPGSGQPVTSIKGNPRAAGGADINATGHEQNSETGDSRMEILPS